MRLKDIKNGGDKFRLFIVDDESEVISSIKSVLNKSEWEVDGCSDPKKSIQLIKAREIDLLIVDFRMKPIDGDKLIEEIRKFNEEIYILLLTGFGAISPPIETLRELQIQGYCEKGNVDQLIMWIESARKVISINNKIKDVKNKMKSLIEIIPELYNKKDPKSIIELSIEQMKHLFNVKHGYILINDIVNGKSVNKTIFKGIGKYDYSYDVVKEEYSNNIIEVLAIMDKGEIYNSGNYMIVPLSNKYYNNFGVIYIENKYLNINFELLEIFRFQLISSLGNIFLYQLSITDGLTGLYNRIYIDNVLIRYFFDKSKYSVIIVDIDNFKKINDKFGHVIGDVVLNQFSNLLKNKASKHIVARFGGEEFIIVMKNSCLDNALELSEQIRKSVEEYKIPINNINSISITISLGVAEAKDDEIWEDVLNRADIALYESKKKGKNKVCFKV